MSGPDRTVSKARRSWGLGVMVGVVAVMAWGAWALKKEGHEQAAGIVGALTFFVFVGVGLAALTRGSSQRAEREKKLKADYPNAPWRWREDWNRGEIKGASRAEAWVLAGMGLAFVALSAPAVWSIPREVRQGNYLILVVLLFAVVGVGLLVGAGRRARQFWQCGTLVFRPEPLPGSWGGFLGGVISIPRGVWLTGDVKLTLRNLRLAETGSGKNRRTRETVRWETETTLDAGQLQPLDGLRNIPVLFHVPRGKGGPSDETEAANRVVWRLSIAMPVRGLPRELTTHWEVPVFDLGETLPPVEDGQSLLAAEKVQPMAYWLAEAGVSETRDGAVRRWRFQQPKASRSGWVLLGFAAVFALVAWFVPVLVMRIAFGGFTLVMAAMLPGIFWHQSELELHGREVVWRRRRGLVTKTWRVDRAEIGDVTLAESMRSGPTRFMRLNLVGIRGVDAETPHPLEHFQARKARYVWRREKEKTGRASDEAERRRRDTPRFEHTVAGYLHGTKASEQVRDYLLEQLTAAGR